MDGKFLVTKNLESVAILKKMGFTLVTENQGIFTFLNNKPITFSNLDDVVVTDRFTL